MQIGMIVCGGFMGLIGLLFEQYLNTIWITVFAFISRCGLSLQKLYPTKIRATAAASISLFVQLLGVSVVSYWSNDDSLSYFVIAIGLGGLSILFMVIISFLPETARKPMRERQKLNKKNEYALCVVSVLLGV